MQIVRKIKQYQSAVTKWWQTGLQKHQRYLIIAIGIVWLLFALSLYTRSAQTVITTTASQNSARVASLNAEITKLPKMSSVVIGQTSGLLPHVQSTRQAVLDDINQTLRPSAPPFWTILHPGYWAGRSDRQAHQKALEPISDQLQTTIDDIEKFAKFIAYSPQIDLDGNLELPDTEERLSRTQQGLQKTRSELLGSGLQNSLQTLAILDQLIPQTTKLNQDSLPDWSKQVARAQQMILDAMTERDILTSDYAETLTKITQSHQ